MAKKRKMAAMLLLMFCFVSVGVLATPHSVYAKKINSMKEAEKLARKKVKNATIVESDKDYEKGVLIYEIEMVKGTKEYNLTYRASDGKLIEYGWEQHKLDRSSRKKKMSESKCRSLAQKKVPGASITSIRLKYDDGIDQYKVKMKKGNKKYELEYHARTRELIGYEWKEEIKPKQSNNNYIGAEKAKQIALSKVPGATVIKVEFDRDDGVPLYEVEMIKDEFEYDLEIHAITGEILDFDQDYRD